MQRFLDRFEGTKLNKQLYVRVVNIFYALGFFFGAFWCFVGLVIYAPGVNDQGYRGDFTCNKVDYNLSIQFVDRTGAFGILTLVQGVVIAVLAAIVFTGAIPKFDALPALVFLFLFTLYELFYLIIAMSLLAYDINKGQVSNVKDCNRVPGLWVAAIAFDAFNALAWSTAVVMVAAKIAINVLWGNSDAQWATNPAEGGGIDANSAYGYEPSGSMAPPRDPFSVGPGPGGFGAAGSSGVNSGGWAPQHDIDDGTVGLAHNDDELGGGGGGGHDDQHGSVGQFS